MADLTKGDPINQHGVGENPGCLLCLPCIEKAANSTTVSNGHSSLKVQTCQSQQHQGSENTATGQEHSPVIFTEADWSSPLPLVIQPNNEKQILCSENTVFPVDLLTTVNSYILIPNMWSCMPLTQCIVLVNPVKLGM